MRLKWYNYFSNLDETRERAKYKRACGTRGTRWEIRDFSASSCIFPAPFSLAEKRAVKPSNYTFWICVPVFVVVVFKKKVSKTVSQLNQYLLEESLTFKKYDRHAHMVLKNNWHFFLPRIPIITRNNSMTQLQSNLSQRKKYTILTYFLIYLGKICRLCEPLLSFQSSVVARRKPMPWQQIKLTDIPAFQRFFRSEKVPEQGHTRLLCLQWSHHESSYVW